jgi:hypothetical protein
MTLASGSRPPVRGKGKRGEGGRRAESGLGKRMGRVREGRERRGEGGRGLGRKGRKEKGKGKRKMDRPKINAIQMHLI